jgi:hypothetical protein
MSHGKRTSKRKGRTQAITVLGVAGALSLIGGASGAAVGPPGDTLTENAPITLDEEEISDVSLSTFYVFDHENTGAHHSGLQVAQRTRSRRGKVAEAAGVAEAARAPEGRMVSREFR